MSPPPEQALGNWSTTMNMGTMSGIITAGVVSVGQLALGSPINAGSVPKDATWAAHVDIEAILASDIGQFALEHAKAEGELDDLEVFRRETGLDPLEDFFGVTISGVGEDESSVVALLEGGTALENVFDVIDKKLDGATHSTFRRNGLTIHKIKNDGETWLATVLNLGDHRTGMVVSASVDRILEAVDGIQRGTRSKVLRIARPSAGSFAFLVASEIPGAVSSHGPASVLFRNADGFAIDVGQQRGRLFLHGMLDTADADTANMALQSVQGLKALATMLGANEPEAAPYIHLLDGLTFGLDGSALTASFEIENEELFKLIAEENGLEDGFVWDEDEEETVNDDERIEQLERRIEELEQQLEREDRRPH